MIDWNTIDTVLLDMDGTLLDLHFDNYFWHEHLPQHWANKHQIELNAAKEHLFPLLKEHEGTLSWYCLDHWSEKLDINIMEIKQEIKHKIRLRQDTDAFLNFLRQENKNVVMVTNAHPDLIDMKFLITQIDVFFHGVINSHELGVAKEEPEFWRRLETKIKFDKNRSILFDDNINVLKSARTYGLENLISIIQPDSQAPGRDIDEFVAIDRFIEVMPE